MTAEMQKDAVLRYMELLQATRVMEREIDVVYSDPEIEDPDEMTAEAQANVETARDVIAEQKPLVEAIIQEQISAVLADEGFGFRGQLIPPVLMHSSPLPSLLVVSPRDEINRDYSVVLKTDVETPERAEIEAGIYEDLDLSAYVTNIGGIAFYPAMIQETTSLQFFIDVVAHEWSHVWFDTRPLGYRYSLDGDVRIINESSASIFGEEIALLVLARYYPEFLPAEPDEIVDATPVPTPTPDPNVPPPFDFRAEMGETRIRVDELLEEGKVDEAEAYMEERRQVFVANGYNLRVLNQAYFAFHGAYAQNGGGAAGTNPIGPLVRDIYEASPSMRAFMDRIGQVGSYEDLLETADSMGLALPSDEPDTPEIPTDMLSCVAQGGVWEKEGASLYTCTLAIEDGGE